MTAYHSALRPPVDAPSLTRYQGARGLTVVADVSRGVPREFEDCDVLYADPPWPHGYDEFSRRAGGAAGSYGDVLVVLRDYCARVAIPVVLVTGTRAALLLKPHATAPVRLPVGDAVACLWRLPAWTETRRSIDVIDGLARRHEVAGDPFCGYGTTGRIFAEAGKRYVMSDLNPRCVGFISLQPWA